MHAQIMSDVAAGRIDAVRNQRDVFLPDLAVAFGATFFQAMPSALFNVVASALASRTLVLPCLPHPPGTGRKISGSASTSIGLLFGRELHHAPGIIGIAERGEDAFSDAEIGVTLMRAFDGSGEGERRAAKAVRRHRALASPVYIVRCGAVCSSSCNCLLVERRIAGRDMTARLVRGGDQEEAAVLDAFQRGVGDAGLGRIALVVGGVDQQQRGLDLLQRGGGIVVVRGFPLVDEVVGVGGDRRWPAVRRPSCRPCAAVGASA